MIIKILIFIYLGIVHILAFIGGGLLVNLFYTAYRDTHYRDPDKKKSGQN